MKTYRNIHYTTRDYECTNVLFCIAPAAPSPDWVECSIIEMERANVIRLYRIDDAIYYGYL